MFKWWNIYYLNKKLKKAEKRKDGGHPLGGPDKLPMVVPWWPNHQATTGWPCGGQIQFYFKLCILMEERISFWVRCFWEFCMFGKKLNNRWKISLAKHGVRAVFYHWCLLDPSQVEEVWEIFFVGLIFAPYIKLELCPRTITRLKSIFNLDTALKKRNMQHKEHRCSRCASLNFSVSSINKCDIRTYLANNNINWNWMVKN